MKNDGPPGKAGPVSAKLQATGSPPQVAKQEAPSSIIDASGSTASARPTAARPSKAVTPATTKVTPSSGPSPLASAAAAAAKPATISPGVAAKKAPVMSPKAGTTAVATASAAKPLAGGPAVAASKPVMDSATNPVVKRVAADPTPAAKITAPTAPLSPSRDPAPAPASSTPKPAAKPAPAATTTTTGAAVAAVPSPPTPSPASQKSTPVSKPAAPVKPAAAAKPAAPAGPATAKPVAEPTVSTPGSVPVTEIAARPGAAGQSPSASAGGTAQPPAAAAAGKPAAPRTSAPGTTAVAAAAKAAVTTKTAVASSPVVQASVECVAVRPIPHSPPVKAGPSLKIIEAPSSSVPQGADGAAGGGGLHAAEPAAKGLPRRSEIAFQQLTSTTTPQTAALSQAQTQRDAPRVAPSLSSVSTPVPAVLRLGSHKGLSPPVPATPQPAPPSAVSASSAGHRVGVSDSGWQATVAAAAAGAAWSVHVSLEDNPGGPCPVDVPVANLDPSGSGEVLVSELVTAAMKALKIRYGPIQAGPSVNAFYVNPQSRERRWLPTFDSVPADLLKEGMPAGAAIVLQGVTCGDKSISSEQAVSHAAVIPLPGFNDASDHDGLAPPNSNRVSFLSEGVAGAQGAGAGSSPAFIQTRSLLRGSSGGGAPPGGTSMKGGARILGNGHRSVRIRTEENTVETLTVESAAPSATSVCSNWRGGKLPPLRGGSGTSMKRRSVESNPAGSPSPPRERRRSLGDGDSISPLRGKLSARTRSSRRLLLNPEPPAVESFGSSDFTPVKRDPVQRLKATPSLGLALLSPTVSADATAACNDGRATTTAGPAGAMPPPSLKSSSSGRQQPDKDEGEGAVVSQSGKKPSPLSVRPDAEAAAGDEESMFFPSPPAEWCELMGADPTDAGAQPQQSGGGCLAFLSLFSANAKAQQQQQWRCRLRAALKTQDEAEMHSWIAFHTGRNGNQDQTELDAALWLALETKSQELVRMLLQAGAQPNAPRPVGQVALASPASHSKGSNPKLAASKVAVAAGGGVGSSTATGPWWSSPASGPGAAAALEGLTPLMRAAELASVPLVELLLQAGADIGAAQPTNGWTALHRAVLASPAASMRRLTSPKAAAAVAGTAAGKGVGVGSGRSNSGSHDSAAAEAVSAADVAASDPALRCAKLLITRMGLQRASGLMTRGRHEDNLLRFAVRYGRAAALRWLLSAGLAAAEDDEDEASCAFLAGSLGLTVEVWDLQPPARASQQAPQRDPQRPQCWLVPADERLFLDYRRQLLMGAAAAGRLDVLAVLLDKPPPYDRLRKDEMEGAVGACRMANPRNKQQVEELLARRVHGYMAWDRELLPALQRLEVSVVAEWLLRDRPGPTEVDRALAAVLSSDRLPVAMWQEAAVGCVKALLEAGADVDYTWDRADEVEGRFGAAASSSSKSLRPLLAALAAPSPAVVRQLLAAGADPRKRDANGENALFFAVRAAVRAAASDEDEEEDGPPGADSVRHVVLHKTSGVSAASGACGDAVAVAAAAECIAVLLSTDFRAELLAARNDIGLTPAFLAAVADLPRLLKQLCDAGADPWAASAPAVKGAPEAPPELRGGKQASVQQGRAAGALAGWSVGHEAARCGALSCLALLIGGQASSGGHGSLKGPSVSSEVLTARRREALIGAIRGGRVGAAKMALDAGGVGGGGSLYEAELKAALALCSSSASAAPLAPPPGVASGVGSGDPPRYEALAAFLSSRAHVYMSWEGEVLPALRAANAGIVRRWISGDKVSAEEATRALCALVEMAGPCAASGSTGPSNDGGGGGTQASLREDLSNLSSSSAMAAARSGGGRGVAEVAAALIQAGADVNHLANGSGAAAGGEAAGQTLLMQAASKGNLPLVEVLVATGARVDAEDAAGLTAVDVAVLARQRLAAATSAAGPGAAAALASPGGGSGGSGSDCGSRCLAVLLGAYGARRLNTHRTHAGDSALMLAVRTGDSAAAQQLLAAGAEPAAADADVPPAAGVAVIGSAADAVASAASNVMNDTASIADGSVGAESMSAPSGRSLNTFPSGLARRGSAVYLAARMDDKPMLHALLRGASKGETGLDACRQEVQLGALHGGRLTLLEASLALPDLLKTVAAPPVDGASGSAPLSTAAAVSGRLHEQAAVRLGEAQGLVRELEAAAAASGGATGGGGASLLSGVPAADQVAPLNPADVARMQRYLTSKADALEQVAAVHERMSGFYERCRGVMEELERALEQKTEQVSSRVRDAADAQVKLMAAQTRLAASRESVLRSVLARRDAAMGRVEALADRRLAGLSAAQRRAEARVASEVESIVMEMRKLVAKKLKDIDTKKAEASSRLEQLERRVDQTWARKQRMLAGRPPNIRVALNHKMGALMQQLLSMREGLNSRVEAAVRKVEAQQRRGTGLVNQDALRGALNRQVQDVSREICEAAARAKLTVSERAEELLRQDKHDDLLRIVGQMQAEVARGSADAAAASTRAMAALQQAFALAEAQLAGKVQEARKQMQEHLALIASRHASAVKAMTDAAAAGKDGDDGGRDVLQLPSVLPDVEQLIKDLDLLSALDAVEGVGRPFERRSSFAVVCDSSDGSEGPYSGMRRVAAVQDMIEDMICDMSDQVLHAYPTDTICDALDPRDLDLLLEPPETDINTAGLGLDWLREEMQGLDFSLPNLDLDFTELDLSALEDEGVSSLGVGLGRGGGGGRGGYADDADEYESSVGVSTGGGGGYGGGYGKRGGGRGDDRDSHDHGGGGRYHAAHYNDRPEDDFAMSYS